MASLGRCETDNMGSLITVREGSSTTPRVMLAAHMDEIGFMVTAITKRVSSHLSLWWLVGACFARAAGDSTHGQR